MILDSVEALLAAGAAAAREVRAGEVITLSGPLGVGKTTFARGFLEERGHSGEVPSPSYAIVQPYDMLDPPVWHVDLYRIQHPGELLELGLDSTGEAILLVEWPDRAGESAWPEALALTLDFEEHGARRLTAKVPPSWVGRWPPR